MDVTFHEKGRNKIAAYILTYEEGQAPNIMEKINADLAKRGKKAYTVGIVTLSPMPPTWNEFADSMQNLKDELEWWQILHEQKRHQEETKRKEKKAMSTSYYIFTELKANGVWHCINGKVTRADIPYRAKERKISPRQKEIAADVFPSPRTVKREELYILKPI